MALAVLLDLKLAKESLPEAGPIIHETLEVTRAFDGCVSCDVLVDEEDATHYVVYEVWESIAKDAAYRAFRKTPAGASRLGEIVTGPPTLTKFKITDW